MRRPFPRAFVLFLPALLVVALVFGLRNSPNSSSPAPDRLPKFATQSSTHPSPPDRNSSFELAAQAAFLRKAVYQDRLPLPQITRELRNLESQRLAAVEETARQLGLPIWKRGPGMKIARLYKFVDGRPVYKVTKNRNAAISSAATPLFSQPYLLSGSGIRIGLWDGGRVRSSHVELINRVTTVDSNTPVEDHATHTAGTAAASGTNANARGMAPAAEILSYDWDFDYEELLSIGADDQNSTSKVSLSNHSYGYDAVTADMGRYNLESQTLDDVAFSVPYLTVFWAAGNEQDLLTALQGFQSVTYTALSKNVITVGAVGDAVSNGVRSPASATMTTFSSWGPCDDGRIKPDLVANGVTVTSLYSSSNSAYGTESGTSMSTPSAAGTAALLAQIYAREFSNRFMRSSLMKALLIHTADDLGNPGPDYKFGWGLINGKVAADVILAHKNSPNSPKFFEQTVTNSVKSRSHVVRWDGVSPLKATLSWTEPAGAEETAQNSRTRNLVHDLNLSITAPNGTTHLPFRMPFVGTWTTQSMNANATTGVNSVDTAEQVLIPNPPSAGNYTINVTLSNTLQTTSQVYSLVVTGTSAPVPTISTSGTPGSVSTVYGTPSTSPTSITVSGRDMTAAITASAPTGHQVALNSAGPYSSSVSFGGAGTIANTTLFVRLAAGPAAANYSGNLVLTSTGAGTVNVPLANSSIQPRPATVTANNRFKPFGTSLAAGSGQTAFSASGLSGTETIGTVTLTASGGTGAFDAPGQYVLTPSLATGGTFVPKNYSLTYVAGTLTVTAQQYGQWALNLADPLPGGDSDGDGLENLVEYFLGLSPNNPDICGAIDGGIDGNEIFLEYRRYKGTQGVTSKVVWKTNLNDGLPWSEVGIADQLIEDKDGYELRRASLPWNPGDARKFLRLEVNSSSN